MGGKVKIDRFTLRQCDKPHRFVCSSTTLTFIFSEKIILPSIVLLASMTYALVSFYFYAQD